ncbi:hypothetical protein ROJ8625_00933 [Roseivivax jejudonensis]|uniref:DUF5681 domain-containing protein n=1 Tax=Roseivivax jejudonensis TaxID=1529041 RepID=A0A1X6YLM2_9RHOB|nr:DUF5681 domain-containing protein [Roseivivax jejudonensis]SLN23289.1 hypothetical protein ROJ8625_00933 [Roseivivax jejudonensis]
MFTYVDGIPSGQLLRAPADRNNGANTATRNADGKFAPGNPGRPRGARHRITRAVEELLEGEAEGITRKAVEMALEGDTTAMRLCLERIAPAKKDAPVSFDLPDMKTAEDATKAAQAVLKAVSEGELTPSEAASVMALVETYRRALETEELERRVAALESRT